MIIPGVVMIVPGPTLKAIMAFHGVGKSIVAFIPASYFLGSVLGILSISFLVQRFRSKQILIFSTLLLSVSLAAFSLSPIYIVSVLIFLLIGFSNGILVTFPGNIITYLNKKESARILNILYGFFASGVLIGPILAGEMLTVENRWPLVYQVMAILALIFAILLILSKIPDIKKMETIRISTLKRIHQSRHFLFLILVICLILYVGTEAALGAWVPTYLVETYKPIENIFRASLILTLFWAGITIGRIIFSQLLERIKLLTILLFLSAVSALFLMVTPLLRTRILSESGYALVGLFFSALFPILISYTEYFPEKYSTAVFSILMASGAAGGMLFPYLVGFLAEYINFTTGMIFISLPMTALFLIFIIFRKKMKR